MKGIIQKIRNIIFRPKQEVGKYLHFCVISKKDKSGRWRYHMYTNGKLCKQECTIDGWVREKRMLNNAIH